MDDGNAYIAAGLAGMGLLGLPGYLSRPHLESGKLVRLFEDWRLDSMQMFIDWIMALMAEHAPVGPPGK